MQNEIPFVSCIMPTANRQEFVKTSIDLFLNQDYPAVELVIIDDGRQPFANPVVEQSNIHYLYYKHPLGTIGAKRNIACEQAKGELIMHWDDDDWYARDWISKQVQTLITSNADITGLNRANFYSSSSKRGLVYQDANKYVPWLCGATLGFKKCLWESYNFADLQIGEDSDFLMNCGGRMVASEYTGGFVAGLHEKNTSLKHLDAYNTIKLTNVAK